MHRASCTCTATAGFSSLPGTPAFPPAPTPPQQPQTQGRAAVLRPTFRAPPVRSHEIHHPRLSQVREYLDGFGHPYDLIGGNHDLEGIDEFATDAENLEAYLRIMGVCSSPT